MNRLISCFEYERLPILNEVSKQDKALTPAQVKELQQLTHLPAGAFFLGKNYVQWQQFCGVVQLTGVTLEILPKVYQAEQVEDARKILIQMLAKAKLLRLYTGQSALLAAQNNPLLDIFIIEFCSIVLEQNRLGRPKTYVEQQDNLPVLKGKLLFTEQMRNNLAHKERLYCQYDEFTDDFLLHQSIRYCLRLLSQKCTSQISLQLVNQLLMQHVDISDVEITLEQIQQLQANLNRQTQRYAIILQWCEIFLSSLNPNVAAGATPLMAVLFDMNRLFEAWVAAILKPQLAAQGLRLKTQGGRKYLAYRQDIEQGVFSTQPDLMVVDKEQNVLLILDTKWKTLNPAESKLGIQQADMYQMTSYGYLYGVNRLALIYPMTSNDSESFYSLMIKDMSLGVALVNLNFPELSLNNNPAISI